MPNLKEMSAEFLERIGFMYRSKYVPRAVLTVQGLVERTLQEGSRFCAGDSTTSRNADLNSIYHRTPRS